ncbi:hypothetical protein [Nocardia barduliensis]|uniref:hypothetical protein n=1 Tax=Nocardia barduliensis TaxID=2736643 RepID=UPI001572CF35|nr:hypothetical protein [Nocardia barduliensis]
MEESKKYSEEPRNGVEKRKEDSAKGETPAANDDTTTAEVSFRIRLTISTKTMIFIGSGAGLAIVEIMRNHL